MLGLLANSIQIEQLMWTRPMSAGIMLGAFVAVVLCYGLWRFYILDIPAPGQPSMHTTTVGRVGQA